MQDPFGGEGFLVRLRIEPDKGPAAICTSGNSQRYVTIEGKRYSHIVDPRTQWPVEAAPAVTVVASDALTADAWATALMVLGPDGRKLLPEGVEAMVVTGTPGNLELHTTPGFDRLLLDDGPPHAVVGVIGR